MGCSNHIGESIMSIILVVAMDRDGYIGNGDVVPWWNNIPAIMARIAALTLDELVVTDRETWEKADLKALAPRNYSVVTQDQDFVAEFATVISDPNKIHSYAKMLQGLPEQERADVYILGGVEILREFYSDAKCIYLTIAPDDELGGDDGDHLFPLPHKPEWEEVSRRRREKGVLTPYPLEFIQYNRTNVTVTSSASK